METTVFVHHLQRKLNVSSSMATNLAKELIERFLPIKRHLQDFDAILCSPSPLLDMAWHELILFTKLYAKLCGKSFLHHNPAGELDDVQVKAQRYAKTRVAYEELFGAIPNDHDIWPALYPDEEDNVLAGKTSRDEHEGEEEAGMSTVSDESSPSPSETRKNKRSKPNRKKARSTQNLEEEEEEEPMSMVVQDNAPSASVMLLQPTMISIRNAGTDTIMMTFDASDYGTVHDIKTALLRTSGIPRCQQRLIFNGQQLQDERNVSDYNIPHGAVIHFMIKQSGC
jgi:hypothetical protein